MTIEKKHDYICILFSFLAFLFPILGIYGDKTITILLALTGLIPLFFLHKEIWSFVKKPKTYTPLIFLIILGFMCLSLIWSVNFKRSFSSIIVLTILGGCFYFALTMATFLNDKRKEKILTYLKLGFYFSIIISLIDFLCHTYIFETNAHLLQKKDIDVLFSRGLDNICLISFLVMTFLKNKPLHFFLIILSIFFMLILVGTPSSIIPISIGFAVYIAIKITKHKLLKTALLFIPLIVFLTTPLYVGLVTKPFKSLDNFDQLHPSITHRVLMYGALTEKTAEKPLIGHGHRSTRSIEISLKTPGGDYMLFPHPHNFSLQIWVELGAIGIFLFSLLIFSVTKRELLDKNASEEIFAFFTALFLIANISYGAFQTQWVSSIFMLCFFYTLIPDKLRYKA